MVEGTRARLLVGALVGALALAPLLGCPGEEGGGDADADGDTDVDGDGDGDADGEEPELSAEAESALSAFVEGLSAAVALGAPLVQDGEALRDDPSSGTAGDARDRSARDRVENGVAGDSIVTDAACVAFDWDRLTVAITFTGCALEQTGESLDGVLSMTISFGPVVLSMTFEDLAVGETTLDGTVTMAFGGQCMDGDPDCTPCEEGDEECAAAEERQRTLTADLTVESGGSFAATLDGLVVVVGDDGSVSLDGAATVASESFSGDLVLTTVTFAAGDCLPSAGTLALNDGSPLTTTLTFLPATPATGEVRVQIGPFPATTAALFPPCE